MSKLLENLVWVKASRHFSVIQNLKRWRSTKLAYPPGMIPYEEDFVDIPEYPTVDLETRLYPSRQLEKRNKVLNWMKGIQEKETVEEKLMEMNIERKYGWNTFILKEDHFDYDALPFMKYVTRSYTFDDSIVPSIYSSEELTSKVKQYSSIVKEALTDVIKFEMHGKRLTNDEPQGSGDYALLKNKSLVNVVTRTILQVLGSSQPFLQKIQVDYSPRSEAFWHVGGFPLRNRDIFQLRKWENEKADQHFIKEKSYRDLSFQYIGSPLLQLRSSTQFQNLALENLQIESPAAASFPHLPKVYSYQRTMRYATNIPGYWSYDPDKAIFLSFHSAHFLNGFSKPVDNLPDELNQLRHPSYLKRKSELLKSQALLVSFSKMVAVANMLGYNQFYDIEYPLNTQTIITDGTSWSFCAYQLNTMKLDNLHIRKNSKQNFCWFTPTVQIFDEHGNINPNFVDMVLKFFLAPTLFQGKQLSESPSVKYKLDDVTDDLKREFILYNFHEMYSLRRHDVFAYEFPEIYDWERIFKIENKVRVFDARKRFFEKPDVNLYTERYPFKHPKYRPKMLKFLEDELAAKKEDQKLQQLREELAIKQKESNLD